MQLLKRLLKRLEGLFSNGFPPAFCCCSAAKSCPSLCSPMDCSTPGSSVLHSLPEFGQIHVSDSSQWCYLICPLLSLLLLPSILPSIRVFFNELALCIRWPKYWGFSFSISSSNKYSEWIFFSIDWFDLLGVQGTLKKSSPAAQFENINSLALSLPSLVRELDPACYS